MTYYFLQSRLNGKIQTVGHSKDEKSGEIYFKFTKRAQCKKLMLDEMKVSPEYEYRIVKVVERIETGRWEKANSTPNPERSVAREAQPED